MNVAFIIWTVMALFFAVMGILARKPEKSAGFWANAEAPEVKDLKAYNKAVSNLWFVFAVIFEILGLPLIIGGQNSARIIISIIGVVMLMLGIMVAYTQIEAKYRK